MSFPRASILTNETLIKPTKQRFIIVAILFIGILVAYLDRVNVSVLAANEVFYLSSGNY
jgi:hypothetical protein